jgi:hypothetical protein
MIWDRLCFTLKNSIYANAFLAAELDWLAPRKRSLEIYSFEVCTDEHVFNTITQLIHTLVHLLTVVLGHHFEFHVHHSIKLDQ